MYMYIPLGLVLGVEAGVVQVSFCTDDNELKLVKKRVIALTIATHTVIVIRNRSCTIVQGISSKMTTREVSIFIIFSDTYTCPYVVYQV